MRKSSLFYSRVTSMGSMSRCDNKRLFINDLSQMFPLMTKILYLGVKLAIFLALLGNEMCMILVLAAFLAYY